MALLRLAARTRANWTKYWQVKEFARLTRVLTVGRVAASVILWTPARKESYPEAKSSSIDELRDSARRLPIEEDAPYPEQVALLRNMTGSQRLALAEALFREARELKAAGVRHQHADWSAEQVMAEVNRIFLNARN